MLCGTGKHVVSELEVLLYVAWTRNNQSISVLEEDLLYQQDEGQRSHTNIPLRPCWQNTINLKQAIAE